MSRVREGLRGLSFRPEPASGAVLLLLCLIVGAGLVLRLHGLGTQSYWYDETLTVGVSGGSLGHVFDALPDEASPPLYYVLAWVWMKVFGTGEEALRSLSALAGVVAIPLVFAIARRLASARAALAAAALAAVNPMLVWYGQEGRNYALLVLGAALTLLLCLRAAERPSPGRLAVWSASCCAALLVHYFAVLVIVPEAAILLACARGPLRPRAAALITPALVGLALIPLAYEQAGDVNFINGLPIAHRLGDLGREIASANVGLITESTHQPPASWLWPGLAAVVIAVGSVLVAARGRDRAGGALAAGIAGFICVVAAVLSPTPLDYFFDRNLIVAWIPLAVLAGAGCAAARPGWLGVVLVSVLCALAVRVDLKVASDPLYQREDWRTLVRALGTPTAPRAIFVTPAFAVAPLEVYGRDVEPATAGTAVSEIDLLGRLGPASLPALQIPGFGAPEVNRVPGLRLVRYRSRKPLVISQQTIDAQADSTLLIERPAGAGP